MVLSRSLMDSSEHLLCERESARAQRQRRVEKGQDKVLVSSQRLTHESQLSREGSFCLPLLLESQHPIMSSTTQ